MSPSSLRSCMRTLGSFLPPVLSLLFFFFSKCRLHVRDTLARDADTEPVRAGCRLGRGIFPPPVGGIHCCCHWYGASGRMALFSLPKFLRLCLSARRRMGLLPMLIGAMRGGASIRGGQCVDNLPTIRNMTCHFPVPQKSDPNKVSPSLRAGPAQSDWDFPIRLHNSFAGLSATSSASPCGSSYFLNRT